MRPEIEIWWKQSQDDFMSAGISSDGEAYYVAVFLCHQAVEKGLKALYIKTKKGRMPQTHSLIMLGKQVGAPKKYHDFLRELTPKYITTRYPDAAADMPSNLYDHSAADKWLKTTKDFLKWLGKKINM